MATGIEQIKTLKLRSESYSYHLGSIHFLGRVGKFDGVHSINGKRNLQRILREHTEKGMFRIVSEDSSYEKDNGRECSGEIKSLTYYCIVLAENDRSLNIPFSEFLESGRPQVIRKDIQFSPLITGESIYVDHS